MELRGLVAFALCAACVPQEAPHPDAKPEVQAPVVPPPAPAARGNRVTECPRSLGGAESGIDRVISRDCGPITVVEDYRIDGGTLTLEAGAILQFKDGVGLVVGAEAAAKLVVAGTPSEPVTLTSASDRSAGAWRGIELREQAAGSQIAGAVIEFAGDEARAVLVAAPEVAITGTTIQEAPGPALRLAGAGTLAAFADNTLRKLGGPAAIVAAPTAMAGLSAGNRFDADAAILVAGGTVAQTTTWANPGVPLRLDAELRVDGGAEAAVLNLSPGTELQFTPNGRLIVGGAGPGRLVARGGADAPIVFTAAAKRVAGGWAGVEVLARGEIEVEHAAFEFAGGTNRGALFVEGGALSLRAVTFRSNRAGVILRDGARVQEFSDGRFAATPQAIEVPPALVGALGEGNAFDADARIVVTAGALAEKAKWAAHGAPLELAGEVAIDAELTLEAGLRIVARPEGQLVVGRAAPGTLQARGSVEAPIHFDPSAGAWPGISFHGQARGSLLRHVVLARTTGAAGVWVESGGEVRLDNVTCSQCKAAVVSWACGARVSQSAVLATDGTPAIDVPPRGC